MEIKNIETGLKISWREIGRSVIPFLIKKLKESEESLAVSNLFEINGTYVMIKIAEEEGDLYL